jgi:quinol-cytochrome oxidoreductase complex cytochrome b subunit
MDKLKAFFVAVLFALVGAAFIVAGLRFLSAKKQEHLASRGRPAARDISRSPLFKATGIFSLFVGILTVVCGILMTVLRDMILYVALIYLGILFIAAVVLVAAVKKGEQSGKR